MSSRRGGEGAMTGRESSWRILSVLGGVVGYGCLAASLSLVGLQSMGGSRRENGRTSVCGDAIRAVLDRMHIPDDATGRLAGLSHWLDAPVNWLGLHKVIEVLPASLALFSVAILGNFLLVYGADRLRDVRRGR